MVFVWSFSTEIGDNILCTSDHHLRGCGCKHCKPEHWHWRKRRLVGTTEQFAWLLAALSETEKEWSALTSTSVYPAILA